MPASTPLPSSGKTTENNGKNSQIWVISDGTAGMRLQAIALGEALTTADTTNRTSLADIISKPSWWLRHLPRLIPFLPKTFLSSWLGPITNRLRKDKPAIIVTCGRRMVGTSIALKRLSKAHAFGTRTIHIQDPRLPPHYFDILIVPQHDPARGANVLTSMASLNHLDGSKIANAANQLGEKWRALPAPRVAVLLGGANQRYGISAIMAKDMASRLASFATKTGASLALIPSRRTPANLITQLTATLGLLPYAVMDQAENNPYPGILGLVDAVIVTSDSVNMISEATITGLPILIAEWQSETGRIGAFHDAMMAAGHIAPLRDQLPQNGFTPLSEMPAIVKAVLVRLNS
ncbi:mitochondrial fission ELM1 family protein [Alphaproteobacteria bacterium]|nr:mitochondrial fission ELM1 family protein [Alphaproteobacteria bacterium]